MVVEAARQVTVETNPTRLFDVPTVVVHPDDPQTVVVAVGDARNGGCQLRVSRDGGLSWATTAANLMPPKLPYCVHRNTGSYIAPAFARDGTLYVALSGTPADDQPNGPMTALVARTTDLGVTSELSTGRYAPERHHLHQRRRAGRDQPHPAAPLRQPGRGPDRPQPRVPRMALRAAGHCHRERGAPPAPRIGLVQRWQDVVGGGQRLRGAGGRREALRR